MVKLTSDEKQHLGEVPDYMIATLPHAANAFFILMRRNMAQSTGQPEERFTLAAAISAVQMVVNLADSDDLRRQVCAWITAGKITPPLQG
jgi:hypothetical protein